MKREFNLIAYKECRDLGHFWSITGHCRHCGLTKEILREMTTKEAQAKPPIEAANG
jgi:hypothetical protein